MSLVKSILKSRTINRLLVLVVSFYIRFVYISSRVKYDINPAAQPYINGESNSIFAFWHGRMMMMPYTAPSSQRMNVMISQHRDGIFISDVMKEFKFATIHGSSSKNGVSALRQMLRLLRHGDNVAITPDGPRGPKQIAASGVAIAAKLSGCPVLPLSFSAARAKKFTSWDNFMLALPFTKIIIKADAPLIIDKNSSDEDARIKIEAALNQVTEAADAVFL